MLEVRRGFQGSFSAKLGVDEFNPKQIAPTIAMLYHILARFEFQFIPYLLVYKKITLKIAVCIIHRFHCLSSTWIPIN